MVSIVGSSVFVRVEMLSAGGIGSSALFHTVTPQLPMAEALFLAVASSRHRNAHAIYLHSGLTQAGAGSTTK